MIKPSLHLIIIIGLALLAAPAAHGRRVVRTGPRALRPERAAATVADTTAAATVLADTIAPARGELRLSGFDKPLRSRTETFFVTNSLADTTATVVSLTVRLDYSAMDGRQLHSAERTVRCHIPPGQTRRVEVPSWDRQQTFYYHRNSPPPRAQGTPFKVSSTVVSAVIMRPM